MVQTLTQYTFLYTCAFELVKHKLKSSDFKDDDGKKKVSFEIDPENNRNTSQTSRSGSDMSSLNDQRQNSTERPTNGTARGRIPITFGSIPKEKCSVDLDNESVM